MKTQKELTQLLAKQAKEIRLAQEQIELADDQEVWKSVEKTLFAQQDLLALLKRKYKDLAKDPALQSRFDKSRRSFEDFVDYLISKKILNQ